MFSIYTTKNQKEYDGPQDLKLYADFLPYIGEFVISFSRLEKRLIWGIESLLLSAPIEAQKIEERVQSFFARHQFFELAGLPVARQTSTEEAFSYICRILLEANDFRNSLLHNSFPGISQEIRNDENYLYIMKEKYAEKPTKRSYKIGLLEIRASTEKNFEICNEIQRWVLQVRPNAENRVP